MHRFKVQSLSKGKEIIDSDVHFGLSTAYSLLQLATGCAPKSSNHRVTATRGNRVCCRFDLASCVFAIGYTLPTYVYLLTLFLSYLLTCLPNYLLTFLTTYLPTYLLTTYLTTMYYRIIRRRINSTGWRIPTSEKIVQCGIVTSFVSDFITALTTSRKTSNKLNQVKITLPFSNFE